VSFVKVNEKFSPEERAAFLQKSLKSAGFGDISWVSSTGSTNIDLIEAGLKGARNLSVLIADHQTAGRGRRDRQWLSEKNTSLLMSVLFIVDDSNEQLSSYSMKLSLAACRTLRELGFDCVRIKWPNDLIVNQGNKTSKLAGVLAQTVIQKDQTLVVVGIGINVYSGTLKQRLSEQEIVALSDLGNPPDRVALAEMILKQLIASETSGSMLLEQYVEFVDTLGKKVRIQTGEEEIIGQAVSVTPIGSLIINLDNGGAREVFVGDVVHLRST
jgi:BirA family biotin operon repressor/biotin-[acetyl-CoA-carboxylase] ligase